jgi:enediyne biosynthesis protein E4
MARLPTRATQCQRAAGPALGLAVCAALAAPPAGTSPAARLAFADVTAQTAIDFVHAASPTREKYLLETMGSGVALLDADGDGRLDLYFVNGAALADPMPAGARPDRRDRRYLNRLYRQTPAGRFEDVTSSAGVGGTGYGMGAAVGDYDNDGDADLYVTAFDRNTLYRNNADGTFTDVTDQAGVGGGGWSASAAFVDVDADGRLDLFVTRYLDWSFATNGFCGERPPGARAYCHPDRYPGVTSLLYHNEGGERFREIGARAGIAIPGKALGVAIADYDRDGRVDIFVANDSVREFLFRSLGGGRFEEVGLVSGAAYDQDGRAFAGMGVAFDDQDSDGWPDLIVTTLSNQLYAQFLNERTGLFTYATRASGLAEITRLRSGWGLALVDADNDGLRDLLVAQGHVLDTVELTSPHITYRQPLLLARNLGRRFVDVSTAAGDAFARPHAARGLAAGDLDSDGRVDVVVTTLNGPPIVLRNVTEPAGHWLAVRLTGTRSNRDGIGATVEVTPEGGQPQTATVSTTGSYLSAHDRTAHFGLGAATRVTSVRVRWPSGVVQDMDAPAIDRVLTIVEPEAGRVKAGAAEAR